MKFFDGITTDRTILRRQQLFSFFFFIAVLIPVLLNVFTPLRLNTDGIRYLNIAELLNGNLDENSYAAKDFLPHGYPQLLNFLNRLHLSGPAAITVINILSINLTCYLTAKLLQIRNKYLYCAIVMLSFCNIKHYTLPLPDQLFSLTFIAGIYSWSLFFKGRRFYLLLALIFTALSIYLRTAGVALILGVVLFWFYQHKALIFKYRVLQPLLILTLAALVVLFFVNIQFLANQIDYLRQLNIAEFRENPLAVLSRLLIHFKEIGELAINAPYSKLTAYIPIKAAYWDAVIIIAGIVIFYLSIKTALKLRLYKTLLFWVFVTYMTMIFVWPFYDTRFLIPAIPILAYLFITFVSGYKAKYVLFASYALLGMASLLYSCAISLNRPFFLNHYGFDASLTNNYRVHFADKNKKPPPVYNIKKNNILYLLQKYDH